MSYHIIAFTGTQRGMTSRQVAALYSVLKGFYAASNPGERPEFHEGDCIGSDKRAAIIARDVGFWVVSHPPLNSSRRAFFSTDETRKEKDYISRNHDMVNEGHILVATPRTREEELRSGTWATIRYAKKMDVPCIILDP